MKPLKNFTFLLRLVAPDLEGHTFQVQTELLPESFAANDPNRIHEIFIKPMTWNVLEMYRKSVASEEVKTK